MKYIDKRRDKLIVETDLYCRKFSDGALLREEFSLAGLSEFEKYRFTRLVESEEKFRTIFDKSVDAIFLIELESMRTLDANEKFCAMLGYTLDELKGLDFKDLHPEEDIETVIKQFKKDTGGEGRLAENISVKCKDGSIIYVDISLSPITLGDVDCVVGIFRDIAGRKRLEDESIKSQKLESLELFSGGIAHDFNNILTTILGNISLVEMKMDPNDNYRQYITVAMNAAERAGDLTKQLMNFSKKGTPEKQTTCIKDLVSEAAQFGSKGSNVKYVQEVQDDLWCADVDYGQIIQVLHNLVINAGQAMPSGGTVKLLAKNEEILDSDSIALDPGRYVKIIVADEGMGIKDEHINKIFDPYFTTKEKGTGLGLASAYSIIKRHGGLLGVDSAYGHGARFYIYLPACESEAKSREFDEDLWFTTRGKVLVMDDDESIREFSSEALKSLGYKADFAKEGTEAIDKYIKARESGSPFDAVLMDITIPGGMGAKDTLDRLLKIDPKVKAIVSSGYSNDPIMVNFHKFGFKGTVNKPYTFKGLSKKLKEVMEG